VCIFCVCVQEGINVSVTVQTLQKTSSEIHSLKQKTHSQSLLGCSFGLRRNFTRRFLDYMIKGAGIAYEENV